MKLISELVQKLLDDPAVVVVYDALPEFDLNEGNLLWSVGNPPKVAGGCVRFYLTFRVGTYTPWRPKGNYGSLYMQSYSARVGGDSVHGHDTQVRVACTRGKETAMLVQALADMFKFEEETPQNLSILG